MDQDWSSQWFPEELVVKQPAYLFGFQQLWNSPNAIQYKQMISPEIFQQSHGRQTEAVDEAKPKMDNYLKSTFQSRNNTSDAFQKRLPTPQEQSPTQSFIELPNFSQVQPSFLISNNFEPLVDISGYPSTTQFSGNNHQIHQNSLSIEDWKKASLGSSPQGGFQNRFGRQVPTINVWDASVNSSTSQINHQPYIFEFHQDLKMADEPSLPSPRSEHGSSPHPVQIRADSMTPGLAMQQDISSAEENFLKGIGNRKLAEVPRNEEGKITCTVQGCEGRTFDRRCEWTKHMDKHERPYRCSEPGCEKLRGFTYSGGLLRHQREVHKKHGGPKELLMCPVPYCKRNTGSGFTRKENRDEHIRRVHRQLPSVVGDGEQQNPIELLVAASNNNPPDTTIPQYPPFDSPTQQIQSPPPTKSRKRKSNTSVRDSMMETDQTETARAAELVELRNQVEKLRRDNEEKDSRISKLEETVQVMTMQQVQAQMQRQLESENKGI